MSESMSPGLVPPNEQSAVIKFIEEPPKHVFVEKWFDVGISIHFPRSQTSDETLESTYTVELKPSLYRYTRGKTSSQPVSQSDNVQLTMNPRTICLPLSKTGSPSEHIAKARCKISCPVQSSKPSAFSIQFVAAKEADLAFEVKPAFSQALTIVNAKLSVESPGWEDIWYKDMGGRDKAMTVIASLVDKDGNKIKDRKVPLHLTLLYDNEERTTVTKQDIFRLVGASSHYIDPETGQASLQFRIEDVSKNHQGQNFIIAIAADKEKSPDVAPVYSRSVCIRSKKKVKRSRDDSSSQAPTPKHLATSQLSHAAPPPPARYTGNSTDPFSIGTSQNTQQIRQAMRGVIKWTEEVVNGLGPLKWNVIGYAQNTDGVIDYNRPYHSMPNPNEKVNQILNMYAEDTREHLRVLLNAVEESTSPAATEAMYGGHHGSSHSSQRHGSNTPYRPEMRQWQNSYQDHTSYNMQGLDTHDSSAMSPQAAQGQPMPPLQPIQMQNQYWPQHSGQGMHPPHQRVAMHHDSRNSQGEPDMTDISIDLENRQADVQYIFAKVFKSLRTDKRLGFPAYGITKDLLGFYVECNLGSGSGRFVPIHKHKDEFGRDEMDQASRILKDAILQRSRAVYALKDWDSLSSMVEHAMMYDWTKDVGGNNQGASHVRDVEIGSPAREYL